MSNIILTVAVLGHQRVRFSVPPRARTSIFYWHLLRVNEPSLQRGGLVCYPLYADGDIVDLCHSTLCDLDGKELEIKAEPSLLCPSKLCPCDLPQLRHRVFAYGSTPEFYDAMHSLGHIVGRFGYVVSNTPTRPADVEFCVFCHGIAESAFSILEGGGVHSSLMTKAYEMQQRNGKRLIVVAHSSQGEVDHWLFYNVPGFPAHFANRLDELHRASVARDRCAYVTCGDPPRKIDYDNFAWCDRHFPPNQRELLALA